MLLLLLIVTVAMVVALVIRINIQECFLLFALVCFRVLTWRVLYKKIKQKNNDYKIIKCANVWECVCISKTI